MARNVENVIVYSLDDLINFSGFLAVHITAISAFGRFI